MTHDTRLGGPSGRFPETRLSVVLATASGDPEIRRRALDVLFAAYRKPVYKYVRIRWRAGNEEAKDLTQGFFASAIDREFLQRYGSGKAKFRTYLRTCLDRWVSNERKAAKHLKRGGDFLHVPLDFETAEGELRTHEIAGGTDPEELFHREWVRGLFASAVDELRASCAADGDGRVRRLRDGAMRARSRSEDGGRRTMNKPLLGLALGGALGVVDGFSSVFASPEVKPSSRES